MKYSFVNIAGLFDMILDSIRRHDGRLCSRKKEQLEQRTVALLHTRAYFRFVLTLGILRKL